MGKLSENDRDPKDGGIRGKDLRGRGGYVKLYKLTWMKESNVRLSRPLRGLVGGWGGKRLAGARENIVTGF